MAIWPHVRDANSFWRWEIPSIMVLLLDGIPEHPAHVRGGHLRMTPYLTIVCPIEVEALRFKLIIFRFSIVFYL